jgi:hypothetical protein
MIGILPPGHCVPLSQMSTTSGEPHRADLPKWGSYIRRVAPHLHALVPMFAARWGRSLASMSEIDADRAVAASGGGDPNPGTYPADMLVDWVRVW